MSWATLLNSFSLAILSGDAGDECFTGFHRYGWGETLWARFGWIPTPVRRALARMLPVLSPSQFAVAFNLLAHVLPKSLHYSNPGDRIHKLLGVIGSPNKHGLYDSLLTNLSGHVSPAAPALEIGFGGTDRQPEIGDFVGEAPPFAN